MSDYENPIWKGHNETTDLRTKQKKTYWSDFAGTEEYIPRRKSTSIAPKLRGKKTKYIKINSSTRLIYTCF